MRIIAVDDEFIGLSVLTRAIKKMISPEAEIKGFRRPNEALKYAREQTVDVAFLDMEISQIHGLIVAAKLKEINPKINLIFVSESGDYLSQAWGIHASDYLVKPVKPEGVGDALTHLRYAR